MRFGKSPFSQYFSKRIGERPSSPRITTLLHSALRGRLLFLIARIISIIGQKRKERRDTAIAFKKTTKEVRIPKPAPGPI